MRKKLVYGYLSLIFVAACAATAASVDYGDNSSEYANDGECDDPRFVGLGLATSVDNDNIKRDANDCRTLHQAQQIRLQRTREEWHVAQCVSINYGNNSSEWANDGECDDPRFTGPGVDEILDLSDRFADATDCRALCNAGQVWMK